MVRMAAGICTVHSLLPWEGTAKCLQGNQGSEWKEGVAGVAGKAIPGGPFCPRAGRDTCGGAGGGARWGPHLVGEAVQAVLGAAHHQDLVYPDKPHSLGTQLDAVLGALGVSVE